MNGKAADSAKNALQLAVKPKIVKFAYAPAALCKHSLS